MSDYTPRAGSTGDLALRYLREHGPTSEDDLADGIDKPNHEIYGLLAWPMKQGAIVSSMFNGTRRYRIGSGKPAEAEAPTEPAQIVVPNGTAAAVSPAAGGSQKPNGAAAIPRVKAGSEYPEGRASQHVLKAEAGRASRPDATDRETPAIASPRVGATGAGQAADAAAVAARLRIALWSDGKLHIVRPGGHMVVFQRDETRQIVEYLDSIALDVVRGEIE